MIRKLLPLFKGKNSTFTLFLLLPSLFGITQDHYFFEFQPKANAVESVNFSIAEVIDARVFTKHCGFVPNKEGDQLLPIDFEEGLEKSLQNLLPEIFEFTDAERKVSMVIQEFHISETNQQKSYGELSILYDFYWLRAGRYFPLLRVDDLQTTSSFKVKKNHCNNIIRSLQAAGKQLAALDWEAKLAGAKSLSKEEILSKKKKFSMLHATAFQAGVYQSYVEFRNNEPSLTDIEIIIKSKGSKELLSKREIAFKNLPAHINASDLYKQMWGFSDGEHIYINNASVFHEASFSRLNALGRFCPFWGKEDLLRNSKRIAGKAAPKKAYVFDAYRGQAYLLDETYLEKILKLSSSLQHKYKQERDRKNPNTQIWYAKELNQHLSSTH